MTAVAAATPARVGIRLSKPRQVLLLLVGAAVVYVVSQQLVPTAFTRPYDPDAALFSSLNGVRDWIENQSTGPFFAYFIDPIRLALNWLVDVVTNGLTAIGWLGVLAIGTALGLVFVTWRTALAVAAAFLVVGLMGLWGDTMITLGQVVVAVAVALAIGVPLGIVAGRSDRFLAFVTPILDFMQIMPTFAYLLPLALFFRIGNATAVVATLIYAMPPAIRLTALGIRGVAPETVEAAASLGSTGGQLLRKVQLPMARTTLGLAVNQTIMMALSMVVITAFVGAGGLGDDIIRALRTLNVGKSFDAGLAIVLLAMILDRLSAAASQVSDRRLTGKVPFSQRYFRQLAAAGVAIVAVGLAVGLTQDMANAFPSAWHFSFAQPINSAVDWISHTLVFLTDGLKNVVSAWLLDPIQNVLTNSPWWLVVIVASGLALVITSRRAAVWVAVAALGVLLLQVWQPAMETLAQVLVGVAMTMLIGVVLGTWAARSSRVSAILRPINDAAQTMPSFVYLIPALALFAPTRFTAIIAAFIYAVPAVIRLTEDGVRGVSPTAIEAATSAGSTAFQTIRKVQLPMARRSLLAAANQGVVLVLAMVVIGGLVGGGGLGYQVVAGFAQRSNFGSGMAAALAIVLLGIMLDRITQGAGARRELKRVEEE
jgi:glycine betaine/proline transport system permease protein